jgi:hypothetical protein
MLTRLVLAVGYIIIIAIVFALVGWLLAMLGVPAVVITLTYALGVVCAVLVLLGVLTGKITAPGGLL